jgi:hypothetical protein
MPQANLQAARFLTESELVVDKESMWAFIPGNDTIFRVSAALL